MTILTVGIGKEYSTISAAVAASHAGDVVQVQAGTYTNDFPSVRASISLIAVGGMVTMVATISPPNGKGIIDQYADLVVDGFSFFGAQVPDHNGAGIRSNNGNLTVRNSLFMNNQDGILAGADANATIDIESSEFAYNGAGDGYSHNIYVGAVKQFTVNNSYFHDSIIGHEIKSRAFNTTITNNRIMDGATGTASYSIDLPNAGNALITGNVIEKGPDSQNQAIIHFGGEAAPWPGSKLTVTGNTVVNDRETVIGLFNQTGITATVTGNTLYGLTAANFGGTTATNTVVITRPVLDTSTIAPVFVPQGPPPPPLTVAVPDGVVYTDFGRDGDVTATGHIIHVGADRGFKNLQQALAIAQDGDTIDVDAGIYKNDFSTATHKVIIQGVGGMAIFTADRYADNNRATIDVQADITIRNLDISGTKSYDGNGAALRIESGHATIVNSVLHNNDTSILAGGSGTTVSVYDSEIYQNGNFDKATSQINIGDVGSFTLQNSYVHDGYVAHEVNDQAYFSRIQNNRIIDGPIWTTSFEINLGHGGDAIISGNVIEKGKNSANSNSVHVGGEGPTYQNSNVQITGNTLISDLISEHPYTFFITGDGTTSNGVAPSITATNNTFVGGIPGSAQTINAVNINPHVATTAAISTALPWAAPAAMKPVIQRGPDTLIVSMHNQAGETAEFIVSVDGTVVGGGTIVDGEDNVFTGTWGAGTHAIELTQINAYNVSHQAIHAYVDSVTLNGVVSKPSTVPGENETTWQPYDVSITAPAGAPGLAPITQAQAGSWFNATFYVNQHPDVAASGMDPFTHYMTVGFKQGYDPSIKFSTSAYLSQHADVAAALQNPLQHFIDVGQAAGAVPQAATPHPLTNDPLVDATWYYAQHPDVAAKGLDAATEYNTEGWKLGYNPDQYFDTNFYLSHNADVAAAGINPLAHYESFGFKEGREPSVAFSNKAYLAANPDVKAFGINPLIHYEEYGQYEGRAVFANTPAAINALVAFKSEAQLFDASYYLAHNADVAAAHIDPLYHYEAFGWHEGRDPSAAFSTNQYLAHYADVKNAHVDPLAHFASYGQLEGRQAFPV